MRTRGEVELGVVAFELRGWMRGVMLHDDQLTDRGPVVKVREKYRMSRCWGWYWMMDVSRVVMLFGWYS